jgi:hypothetical protein
MESLRPDRFQSHKLAAAYHRPTEKVFDIIHNLPYWQVVPPALTIAKLVSGRTVGWVLVRC